MKKINIILFIGVLSFSSCTFEKVEPLTLGCDRTISYANDVVPIIAANCISCHDATSLDGDFTTYEGLKAKATTGTLLNRVVTLKDMPVAPATMSDKDRNTIKCWIDQGAINN